MTAEVPMKIHLRLSVRVSSTRGPASMRALLLPRVCGIIPWESVAIETGIHRLWSLSGCYQWFMMILTGSCCAVTMYSIVQHDSVDHVCFFSPCRNSENLQSDITLVFAGFLSLATSFFCTAGLIENVHLLKAYAEFHRFSDEWLGKSMRDQVVTILLWAIAVAERLRDTSSFNVWNSLRIVSFAVSSLVVSGISYCILYFCRGMLCSVENYCATILQDEEDTYELGVQRWNVVQAILRKIAASIHRKLCILQITVFLLSMSFAITFYQRTQGEPVQAYRILPAAIVVLGILRIFFKAAEVTSECIRVPSLINAVVLRTHIDEHRQYLVQYILQSAAGFYMFNVRVTSQMTMKIVYVLAVVICTILQQTLGSSE